MHKAIILVFFIVLLASPTSIRACTKSCNNEGFCYTENKIEKCKCLDRIYIGESCEIFVNHCANNPCHNGATCIPSPGQYNCLCSGNTYGQNCSEKSEEKYFGQVFLQYNHLAPVRNNNNFLLILTDLGSVSSMVELSTSEYAIVGGITFPSKSFKNTSNIQGIAKELNIPDSPLPAGDVFYYAGKYRMPSAGVALATLTITDAANDSLPYYYKWYFQFGSEKNVGCNPLVSVVNCGSPNNSSLIEVNQQIFVEANITRDCGRDSKMMYEWSISNYFDTETLQSFNANSRSLRIPAFGINFIHNETDIFSPFKTIKLISSERSADGNRYGEAVNRCYIMLTIDKPIAKISGGEYQEYSYTQTIVMDGSESADLSVHPKKDQNLSYSWRCNSIDDDQFCKSFKRAGVSSLLFALMIQLEQEGVTEGQKSEHITLSILIYLFWYFI